MNGFAMKRVFIFFLLILIGSFQCSYANNKTNSKKIMATIKDQSSANDCGCYFYTIKNGQEGELLFYAPIDDKALMNLDGEDTMVKLVKRSGNVDDNRIGAKSTYIYTSGTINVTLYRVVSECIPFDGGCGTVNYKATITVQKDKVKQVVKSLGGCGC